MKLHALMFGFLATASACSPPQKPAVQAPTQAASAAALSPAAEKNIRAQAEAWVDCATSKAKNLDDGRSDAGTIAQAVRSACRSLYLPRDNDDLGVATQIVLQTRNSDPEKLLQLITPAWASCTGPFLEVELIRQYSVDSVATVAARECKRHFQGKNGQDVQILTVVAKQRLSDSKQGPIVGRPQPLPPADKRM